MLVAFTKLTSPNPEIATAFDRWANDPLLVPLTRPNRSKEELEKREAVMVESLTERLKHVSTYLIYANGQLVGEMNVQIDPPYLFRKVAGTAWIAITIGEASARGKGVGTQALGYLEEQVRQQELNRIELGVFEFNKPAINLYQRIGYEEIGRIDNFTYWQGRMWQDIRMEKVLETAQT